MPKMTKKIENIYSMYESEIRTRDGKIKRLEEELAAAKARIEELEKAAGKWTPARWDELAGEWFAEGVKMHASGQPIDACSNEHQRAGWRVRAHVMASIQRSRG